MKPKSDKKRYDDEDDKNDEKYFDPEKKRQKKIKDEDKLDQQSCTFYTVFFN